MRYCFSIKCETFPIPFFFASIIAFYAENKSAGYKYNFLIRPGRINNFKKGFSVSRKGDIIYTNKPRRT